MSLGRAPGRTDLAGGQEGRRPGGCGNFPPGARSTGWLERPTQPRLLQAGSQARTPTHTDRRALAHPRSHTHAHTHTLARTAAQPHSHKARLPPDSAIRTRLLVSEATPRPLAPSPGGAVPPPRARPAPAPLPEPAAAAWSPVPAARGLASPATRSTPAASRAQPSARPSAVAGSPATPRAHPAWVPREAGRRGRAPRRRNPGRPRSRQCSAG